MCIQLNVIHIKQWALTELIAKHVAKSISIETEIERRIMQLYFKLVLFKIVYI